MRGVPGADALIEWFGRWPSFHDAEVLSINLNRSGPSCVRIHTWEMTSEVDARGYYVHQKNVIVSFFLEGLKDIEQAGFSHQERDLQPDPHAHWKKDLVSVSGSCYGVAGTSHGRKN